MTIIISLLEGGIKSEIVLMEQRTENINIRILKKTKIFAFMLLFQ